MAQLSSGPRFLVLGSSLPIMCALAILSATPADAQYSRFGKNKIQYLLKLQGTAIAPIEWA